MERDMQKLMDENEEARIKYGKSREFEKEMDEHAQNLVNSLRKIKPDKSFDEAMKKINN